MVGFIAVLLQNGRGFERHNVPIRDRKRFTQNRPEFSIRPVSSAQTGFWTGLGQRFTNFFNGSGFKTNAELTPDVTSTLYFFYSASVEAGPLAQSLSYVPLTNSLIYAPALGSGTGVFLTVGLAKNPNGFLEGPSGVACGFVIVGGCYGVAASGDQAGQFGVGLGGWGGSGGVGYDFIRILVEGMVNGEEPDPFATKMGDAYFEDVTGMLPINH